MRLKLLFLVMIITLSACNSGTDGNQEGSGQYHSPTPTPSEAGSDVAAEDRLPVVISKFLWEDSEHTSGGVTVLHWKPDTILGQKDLTQTAPNEIVPSRTFHPGGVVVDNTVRPNRIYVLDSGNNRILGFDHIGYCAETALLNIPKPCTNSLDCILPCNIDEEVEASIVIGQSSLWGHGASNMNNRIRQLPNASTLSFIPMPNQVSLMEGARSAQMEVDSFGNLYVVDLNNNRVLRYNNPFETDQVADWVWAKTTFDANPEEAVDDSYGQIAGIRTSWATQVFHAGIALVEDGLWVTDTGNNRLLKYGPAASVHPLARVDFDEMDVEWSKPSSVAVTDDGLLVLFDNGGDSVLAHLVQEDQMYRIVDHEEGYTWSRGLLKVQDGILINQLHGATMEAGIYLLDDTYKVEKSFNQNNRIMLTPQGGIGQDEAGNIYVANYISKDQAVVVLDPDFRYVSKFAKGKNKVGPYGMSDALGMAVYDGQLLVLDANNARIMVWEDYVNLPSGSPAKYFLGTENLESGAEESDRRYLTQGGHLAVFGNKLWVASDNLYAYSLPVTESVIEPDSEYHLNLPNGQVAECIRGIAFDGEKLWLTATRDHLAVRCSIEQELVIDRLIGQLPYEEYYCNREMGFDRRGQDGVISERLQDSLCDPFDVKFDSRGNLFIVDGHWDVGSGNMRILMFSPQTIAQASVGMLPLADEIWDYWSDSGDFSGAHDNAVMPISSAQESRDVECIYGGNYPCSPASVSFYKEYMIVTSDHYKNRYQVFIYEDYLDDKEPDYILDFPFGQPFVTVVDEDGNLLIQDHTWNGVLIYKNFIERLKSIS